MTRKQPAAKRKRQKKKKKTEEQPEGQKADPPAMQTIAGKICRAPPNGARRLLQ